MSKTFGLNWRSYDHERMTEFITIMRLEAKIASEENKKK